MSFDCCIFPLENLNFLGKTQTQLFESTLSWGLFSYAHLRYSGKFKYYTVVHFTHLFKRTISGVHNISDGT